MCFLVSSIIQRLRTRSRFSRSSKTCSGSHICFRIRTVPPSPTPANLRTLLSPSNGLHRTRVFRPAHPPFHPCLVIALKSFSKLRRHSPRLRSIQPRRFRPPPSSLTPAPICRPSPGFTSTGELGNMPLPRTMPQLHSPSPWMPHTQSRPQSMRVPGNSPISIKHSRLNCISFSGMSP